MRKKKDKIIIVNDEALDRREARQKKMKKILTVVVIVVLIAIVTGFIVLFKNVNISSWFHDRQQKMDVEEKVTEEMEQIPENTETETIEIQPADHGYERIETDQEIVNYDGVVVVDHTAYEMFTYRKAPAKSYAEAVSKLAAQLDGIASVYDMVVPLSSEIIFPDNLKDEIDSTDQHKAMRAIMGMMDKKVKNVDIYDVLMSHRTEYIYFRTDHHWTARGAYYAYTVLCEKMGIKPEELEKFQTKEFDGFLGSFYNDTKAKELKQKPDVITAYLPQCETKMTVTPLEGEEYEWDIIYDVSSYGASLKYSTFIASDNPYTEIENKDLSDGSACVVVKESFANAFVPFLVDHYQYVYVVDYRYWEGNLANLVKDKKAKDVILLNNLSMIRNQYLVGQFQGVIE